MPGELEGGDIKPGTSGTFIHGDPFMVPLPLSGADILRAGKPKSGLIPVAQKASGVYLDRIPITTQACACVRGSVYKTCGGTEYEADGITASTDCTSDATVCTGKKPCVEVAGPGNAGEGVIGCSGLPSVSYSIKQDAGGEMCPVELTMCPNAGPAFYTRGPAGPAGSLILASASGIGTVTGPCSGSDPSMYGPDGEFCTDDDPFTPVTLRGTPTILTLVSGTAAVELDNVNGVQGDNLGPYSVTGSQINCEQVATGNASGAVLVGAFTAAGEQRNAALGDTAVVSIQVAAPGPPNTSIPTNTPTSNPPTSPTPIPCIGDCSGTHSVAVNDVITLVNIALGTAQPSQCPDGLPPSTVVNIALIVQAVNNELNGCPASPTASATSTSLTPTPTASPRGTLVINASEGVGIIGQTPGGPIIGAAPQMPAQYRVTHPDEVRVETFIGGLEVPWSLAFAPDGRLFISERPGRVRVASAGVLDPTPWATFQVSTGTSEGGLMGLALDPDFANDPWVYVCYTFDDNGTPENRISRVREVNGHGGNEEILLDHFPGAVIHDGCRLKFGPDGKLYATTGDSFQRSLAQDLGSLAGKILRLNRDGSVPADNPFGGDSLIYSYGHRNPQGLAFDPQSGALFETEHGPSGEVGFGNYDEVNIIVAGGNYGWPIVVGAPHLAAYVDPLLAFPDFAVPPAGATFYTATRIPQWTGNFFFTSLRGEHLQRVVLDASRTQVVAIERLFEEAIYQGLYGRLREVTQGPDDALYFTTSNRDGRGQPAPDDDRVLRLVPAR